MTQTKTLADAAGTQIPPMEFEYTERDLILYALGIGATELDFVYERNLKAIPSFAVIPAFPAMTGMTSAGIEINLVMVLHGEQSFRIHEPIPTKGKLTTSGKVASVYDKGKGALLNVATETRDEAGEAHLREQLRRLRARRGRLRRRARARGRQRRARPRAGQDGRDAHTADPGDDLSPVRRPQPAAHRPRFREDGGLRPPDPARPLHASVTFAAPPSKSTRGNDPARFTAMSVRFSGVVYPGDTIITEMWDEGERQDHPAGEDAGRPRRDQQRRRRGEVGTRPAPPAKGAPQQVLLCQSQVGVKRLSSPTDPRYPPTVA